MKVLQKEHKDLIAQIPGLGEIRAEIMVNEGYKDPADIARIDPKTLVRMLRLTPEETEVVIRGASELAEQLAAQKAALTQGEVEEDPLDELADFAGAVMGHEEEDTDAAIEDIVAQARPNPLLDPEKVDLKQVAADRLRYWMKIRGVAEHLAAVLHVAGFEDYGSLVHTSLDDIALKTGLPLKLIGKLHAETAKVAGI